MLLDCEARGADLGVGDLVVQQRVQLGGLGAGVPEAPADGLDGHPGVDQLGGVGVAQLVDLQADPGRAAVALPAVVGCIIGQRPARPVDAGAEQRPGGVAGAGQVQPEQRDVAAVVQQHRPHRAALAVDAHVLVVRAQVQVLDVEPAGLGGTGAEA